MAQTLGWNLYDSAAEYNRMGIPNNLWKHIKLNLSYEVQLTGMKINTYFMFFTNRCASHIAVCCMYLVQWKQVQYWAVPSSGARDVSQCSPTTTLIDR